MASGHMCNFVIKTHHYIPISVFKHCTNNHFASMRVLWRNNLKIVIRATDSFVRFLHFSAWRLSNVLNMIELR